MAAKRNDDVSLPFEDVISNNSILCVPLLRGRKTSAHVLPMGCFTSSGDEVSGTQIKTLLRHSKAEPQLFQDFSTSDRKLEGAWVFGGIMSFQFGHFFTRSLGRLWALENMSDDIGVIYLSHGKGHISKQRARSYLQALGIDRKVHIVTRPTWVETLYTAPELFGERALGIATPAFTDWVRRKAPIQSTGSRKIYISRSGLRPTVGRMLCEEILERNLEAQGFEAVLPETMPLRRQFQMYYEAAEIIAMESSALHAMAFVLTPNTKLSIIQRRREVPELIKNQLTTMLDRPPTFVDAIDSVFWPPERADNISLAQLDFDRLYHQLDEIHRFDKVKKWSSPTDDDLKKSLWNGRSSKTEFRNEEKKIGQDAIAKRQAEKVNNNAMHTPELPRMSGVRYFRMLNRMHKILKPKWYLEVGTGNGKRLSLAKCNTVAVDPAFKLAAPVTNTVGNQMFFFQQTGDTFFENDFLTKNKINFDFAFLDGLHFFEVLLRNFINTEKFMNKDGVIALHDCCPTTEYMAEREFRGGDWTGDVWKTLLILLKHRPDLRIDVANAARNGLAVVRNLDPKNTILEENYDALIAEYDKMSLADLDGGILGLYSNFELLTPEAVLQSIG